MAGYKQSAFVTGTNASGECVAPSAGLTLWLWSI